MQNVSSFLYFGNNNIKEPFFFLLLSFMIQCHNNNGVQYLDSVPMRTHEQKKEQGNLKNTSIVRFLIFCPIFWAPNEKDEFQYSEIMSHVASSVLV